MTLADTTVQHGAFVLQRDYQATPAQVFSAWASVEAKRNWFHGGPGWTQLAHSLDFRVGGREISHGQTAEGVRHDYDAHYQDIVPDARIILAFSMMVGPVRISSSLLTVSLQAEGRGTRLVLTEQIAVLDPRFPMAGREEGTRWLLENLAAYVEGPAS